MTQSNMSTSNSIRLHFGPEISEIVRARILYALRVFAAIYNYRVVELDSEEPERHLFYGSSPEHREFTVPARYIPETDRASARSLSKHRYAEEEFPLAFGIDEKTGNPDWLGEIFQWLSSSHESGVAKRDSVGRIPYRETAFCRQGISARKPYASMLMGWLENALRNRNGGKALCKASSPSADIEHMVVCSHDIDFYHTSKGSTLFRLLKNLGVSVRIYRSWSFLKSNSVMILELLGGKRIGDYLPALLKAIQQADFHSTFFVVARHGHRRDPNYRLSEISSLLSEAERKGCSVCVHGSYTSVLGEGSLGAEVTALENLLGKKPLGSRQHWLRFDTHEKLFAAVENSALIFDSTLGFPDVVGFRNGASFAFPPYNFREERPCTFLEIPLVLMDGSLECESRAKGKNAQEIADEVLMESRKNGWGGFAALWHNPMEPLAVPEEINQVFWKSVEKRPQFKERWMSAQEFLTHSLSRYRNAGLLEGVKAHA
jgi:hypothetical protein